MLETLLRNPYFSNPIVLSLIGGIGFRYGWIIAEGFNSLVLKGARSLPKFSIILGKVKEAIGSLQLKEYLYHFEKGGF